MLHKHSDLSSIHSTQAKLGKIAHIHNSSTREERQEDTGGLLAGYPSLLGGLQAVKKPTSRKEKEKEKKATTQNKTKTKQTEKQGR